MTQDSPIGIPLGLSRVSNCRFRYIDAPWPFAVARAEEISAHWQRRVAESPSFFNGRVILTTSAHIDDGVMMATATAIDFAAFLYWRETGYEDRTVIDAFGSALILSADGALMLARQRDGGLNTGRIYPPGGFIDPRDVGRDGMIDLEASIAREVVEETRLSTSELARDPGFVLSCNGPQLSIGKVFRSPLPADALRTKMMTGMAQDPEQELIDIVVLQSRADARGRPLLDWAQGMVDAVLD